MGQGDKIRDRSVDMTGASPQDRYGDTDSRRRSSKFEFVRSRNIQACAAGCIRVKIRRSRPSYIGRAANVCRPDYRRSVSC